jgi:hypothetical protein
MSKSRIKILSSTLFLVLLSGCFIRMQWDSPVVILVVPGFLFFLLFFIILVRQGPVRKAVVENAAIQIKAGHVS